MTDDETEARDGPDDAERAFAEAARARRPYPAPSEPPPGAYGAP